MHLEAHGEGPSVVLLHGMPTDPAHMAPLARKLAASHRVWLTHLPGYGSSPALPGYDLVASHGLLEKALLDRGVTEAHFVGFSAGAYRAFALAHRRAVRVLSVVSLGGFADLTAEEKGGFTQYAAMLRAGVDPVPVLEGMMLSARGRALPAAVRDVRAWATSIAAEDLALELEAWTTAPDLRRGLRELRLPITARVGLADAASPPERSRRIAAAAPTALEEVPDVGHALLSEDFDATVASVARHLAAHG